MSVCPFGRHFTFKPLVVTDFEKENVSEAVGSPGEEAQPGASSPALRILGLGRCSPLLHRAGKPFEHDLPGKAMALSALSSPSQVLNVLNASLHGLMENFTLMQSIT